MICLYQLLIIAYLFTLAIFRGKHMLGAYCFTNTGSCFLCKLTSRFFLQFKIIPTRHLLYAHFTQIDEKTKCMRNLQGLTYDF